GISSINRIHGMADHMHDFELKGLHHVARADAEVRGVGRELRDAVLYPRGTGRDTALRNMQEHFRKLNAAVQESGAYFMTSEGKALHQRLQGLVRDYEQGAAK